jgi:hypothetical protein
MGVWKLWVAVLALSAGCALDRPSSRQESVATAGVGGNWSAAGAGGSAAGGNGSAQEGGRAGSTAGRNAPGGEAGADDDDSLAGDSGSSAGGEAGLLTDGGLGGEPGADAGTGGEPVCVPLLKEVACGGFVCGPVPDGCGSDYSCGECEPQDYCDDGWCRLRDECECHGFCGREVDCPVEVVCGEPGGGCPSNNAPPNTACIPDEDGTRYCRALPFEGCELAAPSSVASCCASLPIGTHSECALGFVGSCQSMHAFSVFTSEPCGSCINHDGQKHYCGPGWDW